MYQDLKKILYFPLAYYFYFFAKIKLKIWDPKIICITGSSGKTTMLHLLESQIENAHFSHKANSSYGIPFDILGIKRKSFSIFEWPLIFLSAPISLFSKHHKEKIYVAEVDCDRPHEGKFLASLLNPDITIWLSIGATHTKNFSKGNFSSLQESVAFEYGYLIEKTTKKIYVNGDSQLIGDQLHRANSEIEKIHLSELKDYKVLKEGVVFKTNDDTYKINYLLPKEIFYSIMITQKLLDYLEFPFDRNFSKLTLPPGRSSLFKGIKNTTIIDSSYNSSLISLTSMLNLLKEYPSTKKWVVIGDLLELGTKEKEDHEKIGESLNKLNFDRIILVGPRTEKYTFPQLKDKSNSITFLSPLEALEYITRNIKGDETILFKGARFLEGVIEHLLENKNDIKKLCRREKIWGKRRKEWGL